VRRHSFPEIPHRLRRVSDDAAVHLRTFPVTKHHPVAVAAAAVLSSGLCVPVHAIASPYSDINAAAAKSPITVRHVRGNVSMLDGSG
jgi:hypothetical protein